jgi:hypothetical protein
VNGNEIMKLLACFPVTRTSPSPGYQDQFFQENNSGIPIFLDLFSERRFLLLEFLCFVDDDDEAIYSSKRFYKLKPILDHLHAKLRSV